MAGSPGRIAWESVFQEAALEPERWLPALRLLADATGSARAQMIGIGGEEAVIFNWVTGFEDSEIERFAQLGLASPQLNYRVNASVFATPGALLDEPDYVAARARLSSDVYLDYCRDLRIPLGCQTSLIVDGVSLVGLALLRTEEDGVTSQAGRAQFMAAARAARAAVRLQKAIEQQGAELLAGTLDAMTAACLIVDAAGRVRMVTPRADALLAEVHELQISADMVSSNDPVLAREIAVALRTTIVDRHSARVMLRSSRRLDLFPLQRRPWALGFAPAAVLVIRDYEAELWRAAAAAMDRFGFTQAEAHVATLLAKGQSRQEIARTRGVGEQTLRSQIKSIFLKTGCRREAELVALIRGLA